MLSGQYFLLDSVFLLKIYFVLAQFLQILFSFFFTSPTAIHCLMFPLVLAVPLLNSYHVTNASIWNHCVIISLCCICWLLIPCRTLQVVWWCHCSMAREGHQHWTTRYCSQKVVLPNMETQLISQVFWSVATRLKEGGNQWLLTINGKMVQTIENNFNITHIFSLIML